VVESFSNSLRRRGNRTTPALEAPPLLIKERSFLL
jgi:hypothetical protein